jgi:ribosomal protein L37AE/L43A
VTVKRAVQVEFVSKLLAPGSVKAAVTQKEPRESKPKKKIEYVCPNCRQHQKKSKSGDLCWRCQKKADAINKAHAPISMTPPGNQPQAREHETNPLFAKTEGFRTQPDGVISAKKLG